MSCPGLTRCRVTCLHRRMVWDYREERSRQEEKADVASCGYATERVEYLRDHPLINFEKWLRGHRR